MPCRSVEVTSPPTAPNSLFRLEIVRAIFGHVDAQERAGIVEAVLRQQFGDLRFAGARRPEQRDDAHVLLGADDHVLEKVQEIAAHALLADDLGPDCGIERLHVAGEFFRLERIDRIARARLEEGVDVFLFHCDGSVARRC